MRHRMTFCSLAMCLLVFAMVNPVLADNYQFYRIKDKILQVPASPPGLSEALRTTAPSVFNPRWVCDIEVDIKRMKIKMLNGQIVVETNPISNITKTIPILTYDIDAPPDFVDPPFITCDTTFNGEPVTLEMKMSLDFHKQNGQYVSKNFFHFFHMMDANGNRLLSADSQSNSIVPYAWLLEMQKTASLNTGMDGYIDSDGGLVFVDLFDADIYYTQRLALDIPARP